MKKTLFQNIRIIDGNLNIDSNKDLLIDEKSILEISEPFSIKNPDYELIKTSEASFIIPGIIDLRVESRDPGSSHTDNLETLLKSAAKSGVTTIACLPNTKPVIDDPSMVESLSLRAQNFNLTKLLIYGAASIGLKDEKMSELGLLKQAGVVGFTNANKPIYNPLLMKRILSYSTMLDLPVIQHADIPELSMDTEATESENSTRLGLRGVPSIAEAMLIERAKNDGLKVTCDTSPPYFMLNDLSLSNYDTRYKLSPPLRSDEDRKFVELSLKNGIIDAISSDHSPQNRDSKLLPFAQAKPGSLGLETLFSTTLSLVNSDKLPIEKAIHLITSGPAKVLNLNLGTISKGRPADLTVIDPDKSWIVKGESMNSLSSNTCFEKMPMQGIILSCWKNGRKIF